MRIYSGHIQRIIHYEVQRILGDNGVAIILCICLPLAIQTAFFSSINPTFNTTIDPELVDSGVQFSTGDLIAFSHRGMEPFDPMLRKFFILDMYWAAPYFLLGYLSCSAFANESKNQARQIVPLTQSRFMWIASKYACSIIVTISYFVWELLLSTMFSLLLGGSLSLIPTQWSVGLSFSSVDQLFAMYLFILIALLACMLLLTAFSTAVGAIPAYVFLLCFVVASAYFVSPLLFLGGSMMIRNAIIIDGFSYIEWSFVAALIAISISLVLGFRPIRKVEVL